MASRLYRALLRLFPGEFRGDFGEQMAADFDDQRRDAGGRPRATRRLWLRTLLDIARNAPREHLDVVWRDAIYAMRGFRRRPVSTATIVLSLALGVGLNATVFSVVRAVLWRDLPFPDSRELVLVGLSEAGGRAGPVMRAAEWLDLEEPPPVFASLGAAWFRTLVLLDPDGEPKQLNARGVDPRFFETLGVAPVLGRRFTPSEHASAPSQLNTLDGPPPRALMLSHRLWQEVFGGDPDIAGRIVRLSGGEWMEIAGVMGPELEALGPLGGQAWVPGRVAPGAAGNALMMIGRLAPGTPVDDARRALVAAATRGADPAAPSASDAFQRQATAPARPLAVTPLLDYLVGDVRPQLTLLFGAVVCVLLAACANVVNLFLAGTAGRRDELATRVALGAGRGRLVRLALTEIVLLAVAGGVCGTLLAWWAVPLLVAIAPPAVPRLAGVGVDAAALAFAATLTAATGAACGLVAALASSRSLRRPPDAMRIVPRIGRFRQALVAVQVALALILAIGATLMVRSVAALGAIELGFDPAGVVAIQLPSVRPFDLAKGQQLHLDLHERISALPGVRAAGVGLGPLSGGMFAGGLDVPGNRSEVTEARVDAISPGYFEALGASLLAGRFFVPADLSPDSATVVLVNATAARTFWGDDDPINKTIVMNAGIESRVVGVVADTRGSNLEAPQGPTIYQLSHQSRNFSAGTMLVKVDGDAEALTPAIRAIVRSMAPKEPFGAVAPLQARIDRAFAPRRFVLRTIGFFSLLALVLAVVGVYAVLADLVTRRTPEVGIRIALGATSSQVLRLILRHGLLLAVAGLLVGVCGAALLRNTISSMLYGIEPLDPASYVIAACAVLAAVAAACALPARRAARIDPIAALRLL